MSDSIGFGTCIRVADTPGVPSHSDVVMPRQHLRCVTLSHCEILPVGGRGQSTVFASD
jgi:hypothetical protein